MLLKARLSSFLNQHPLFPNKNGWLKRVLQLACIVLLLLPSTLAYAQENLPPKLVITNIDTREFPQVQVVFRYQNPAVEPLTYPLARQVQAVENGKALSIDDLRRQHTGMHFAIALNPGFDLTVNDQNGIPRFTQIKNAISTIGGALTPAENDLFSLFINPEENTVDMPTFGELNNALGNFNKNMRVMPFQFLSLENAIKHLGDSSDPLDKVLLYISPYPNSVQRPQFVEFMSQAKAKQITVYAWVITDRAILNTEDGQTLVNAVSSTGGSISAYNGWQPIPNPIDYINGLGERYVLSYTSEARQSGAQELAVCVEPRNADPITSPSREFQLEIQPASLTFLNLPSSIDIYKDNLGHLTPDSLTIEVAIDFPDKHPRGIESTDLWINGSRVAQNFAAPYGSFILNLVPYETENNLEIKVKLVDSLGFDSQTKTLNLPINLILPPKAALRPWYANPILLGALAGFSALSGLVLLLFKQRRNKPSSGFEPTENSAAPEQVIAPPIPTGKALAVLMRMDKDGQPSAEKPYQIFQNITKIGRDMELCDLVLDDPALEPLHAKLNLYPDGRVLLVDLGSHAGTWVNYNEIPPKGVELNHGDQISLGNHTFKFTSPTRVSGIKPAGET